MSTEPVQIRPYRPADRDAILALAPRLTEGKAPWRDDDAWLAAVRGWVAGFVHATERTHFTGQVDAYVGELVTATGQERRGIARALMQAAEEWGAARGLGYLTLETGMLNDTARAFYQAIGYREEDVRLTRQLREADDVRRPDLSTPRQEDLPLHRRLAAELFNGTWTLLEQPDRTRDDDARMIHMAHASAYHWLQAGTPVHFARSHWLCSRVYSVLGRPEPALYHAQFVLDLCEQHGIGDFDLGYACEAFARAHAVAGDGAESAHWRDRAQAAVADVAEEEDRELLLSDLRTIPGAYQA